MLSKNVFIRSSLAMALLVLGVAGSWVSNLVSGDTNCDNGVSVYADGPTPNWVQVTTSHSPPAREGFAMAYDSARGVVVLFGGQLYGGDLFNDTWEYDGTDWTHVVTENRPSARVRHALAYDASRDVTVLFGGWDGSSLLSDTWEYDGTNWRQRTPSVSPRARHDHALVYDSTHSVVILFGGYYEPWLNDTWEWDGVTWTKRIPTTSGPYRSDFWLAYDSERRVVVLFGGNITGTHDDTWEYDGTTWIEKYPPTKPQPLQAYGMAYDEARKLTVLFGGLSAGGQDDTWEYNGDNWVEASPANSPPARWKHAMVYDNLRNRMVVFGGINNHFVCFDDTWEYGNIIAVESATLTPPSPVTAETVEFEIAFSEEMNTSVAPTVTIGIDTPYTDYTIPPKTGADYTNGYLNSDTTKWYGTYTFTDTMDNGTYHISISGAEGSSGNRMQPDKSETFVLDTVAPGGSLSIDDDAVYANTTSVTLTPSATDATSGVAQMQISNDGVSYDPWESYASTKSWTLPSGEGLKTVYVKYRDNADNVSTPYTDTITLVTSGFIAISGGDDYVASIQVTLTLQSPFTAEQMHLSHDGSSWEPWEDFAATRDWTLQSGDGEKAVYGQFYDGSQFSDVYSDTIVLDTTPPTVALEIAAGAYAVNTTTVTATVAGSDATSGMDTLEWSNDGSTWGDAEPFVAGTHTRTLEPSTYAGPDFGPQVIYGVMDAESVAVGDLDGDGDLDLVTANHGDDNVSVLMNHGDGTFTSQVTYGVGDGPRSVAVGDLDGDNDLDLVTANLHGDPHGNTVSVLLNQGDGTFASRVDYGVGIAPWSVTMGDLDGDGDLDLVTANINGDNISVLLNEGDGTFASQVTYGVGDGPYSVAVGDLDGDGDLDLVTANQFGDDVSVLLNLGDGTFTSPVNYGVGSDPWSVTMGDLDGDGDLDLVTANRFSDDVSVLLNWGDGTFASQVTYGAGDEPSRVVVGDLDGDGDLDLVTANYYDNVSVLLNHLHWPPLEPTPLYVRTSDRAGWSTVFSDTVYVDTAPPWGGSLLIADDAQYTAQLNVELTPMAYDQLGSDHIEMAFRNAGDNFGDWVAYSTTHTWTLPSGDGDKTVEAKYGDVVDNESDVVSDTITLDQTPPTGSSVSINDGATTATQVTVTLTLAGSDALSGVSQMRFSADGSSWGTLETFTTTYTWALDATDGLQAVYAQLRDTAGNVATAVSDTITVEVNPPLGEITINGGATWTNQVTVTLTLAATDAGSGVASMRLREAGDVWGSWIDYTAAYSFTLSEGDGTKTVEVQYEDGYGRRTDTLSDSIVLDTAPPSSSVADLPTYQSTLSFPVSWSGSDTTSGIASYDVQFRDGTSVSWEDWQTDTVATSTAFAGAYGHTYYFQSRAQDNAGNVETYPDGDGDTHVCVIFGDLDGNGRVDVADIQRVASHWRMTADDPDWEVRYDLDGDGIITVVDIMKVVAHWGEKCE